MVVCASDATLDVTDMTDEGMYADLMKQSVMGASTRGQVTWIVEDGKQIAAIVPVCCADEIKPHKSHQR